MSAFKTLKKSDVQITPYPTNKVWKLNENDYDSLGIKIFLGKNLASSGIFSLNDSITYDLITDELQYSRLVYENIKHLYYTNYLSQSNYISISSSFDNFDQNTIVSEVSSSYKQFYNSTLKYFPTASNSIIRVISIPKNIFGSKIIPGTFRLTGSNYNIIDDKEGNLFDRSGSAILIGNIIYPHGIATITNPDYTEIFPTSSYGNVLLAEEDINSNEDIPGADSSYDNVNGVHREYNLQDMYNASLYFDITGSLVITTLSQSFTCSFIFGLAEEGSGSFQQLIETSSIMLAPSQSFIYNFTHTGSLILTHCATASYSLYDVSLATSSLYNHEVDIKINVISSGSLPKPFNLVFQGEHVIYENEVRCQVNEDEFNYTLNPSITTDFSGSLRGFSTASYFNPYVTTVGLYNEVGELLVVGKMAKSVPMPRNNDLNLILKWDS